MIKLYYMPPSDEAFEEMRSAALTVWSKYRDEPGDYYEEKTSRLRTIGNVGDNFMYIFAMFDIHNQRECVKLLDVPTRIALKDRLLDGGNPESFINQIFS